MQTRIAVPLDGSPFANRAIPLALALARRSAATVELLHVHEQVLVAIGAPPFSVRVDDDERARMRAELVTLAEELAADSGVEVVAQFLDGDVLDSLRHRVVEGDVGLVVMMTHGRRGMGRLWLGSVADGLVRESPVPVLLMRAGAEWPQELREPLFPRVLVPLDDSDIGEEILPLVLSLATPGDTTLVLLSVVDPAVALRASAVDLRPDDQKSAIPFTESVKGATEVRLTRLADELRANWMNVVTEVIVDSHPAQCIVTYAERQRIDLVALSTHSRGALGRVLMGATADKVIRGASTPVLVFHPGGRGSWRDCVRGMKWLRHCGVVAPSATAYRRCLTIILSSPGCECRPPVPGSPPCSACPRSPSSHPCPS